MTFRNFHVFANKKRRGRMGGYFDLGYCFFLLHLFFFSQLLVSSYGKGYTEYLPNVVLEPMQILPLLCMSNLHIRMHTCTRACG